MKKAVLFREKWLIFPENHFTKPLGYDKIIKLPAPRIRDYTNPYLWTG